MWKKFECYAVKKSMDLLDGMHLKFIMKLIFVQ